MLGIVSMSIIERQARFRQPVNIKYFQLLALAIMTIGFIVDVYLD
jgi:hypothetical protein